MNKLKEHKKILFIAVPALVVLLIIIIAAVSLGGEETMEPTVDLRNASRSTDAAVSAGKVDTAKELNGHFLIAENAGYELYLKKEVMSVIVRDKETGATMESTVAEDDGKSNPSWAGFMKCGINLDVQVGNTTQQKKVDLISGKAEVNVTAIDGGFTAKLNYPQYEFGFELTVLLYDDGSIEASIPESSIYENSETNRIGNIYVFPMLGRTRLGETEGYMIVPDGNGALINLNDKEGRFSAPYSQRVFGSDVGITESFVLSLFWGKYETINESEYILAPVYGMVHSDSSMAYLAVITSGAEGATIMAYPNGVFTDYNWVSARFLKRTLYNEPTSNSGGSVVKVTDRFRYDISVRYFFTKNEEANYAGLANRYRDYLLKTGTLVKKADDFRLRADFLGTDRESWMFTTKAVTMTTTDDIRRIYGELRDEGVTDLLTLYKGWQDGGICSLPVDSYDADKHIGGTRDLTRLMEEAKDAGIQFYLYVDALRANPDTTNTTFNVIKKIDTRLYTENTYKEVYESMRFLTPTRSGLLLGKLVDSMTKKGADHLALTGITNTMFSYRYSGTSYDRIDTAQMQATALEEIASKVSLALEEPIETYWKYMDSVIDMPVKDSDYIFTDESIPFLSIVFKGIVPMYSDYVNFEANKHEFFLKLVETGIYPSFYLTMEDATALYYTNSNDLYSSQYNVYKDTMIEYYKVLKEFNSHVAGATIDSHRIEGKLVTVGYSNGVTVTVDYSSYAFTVAKNGSVVMSYKVGGAE